MALTSGERLGPYQIEALIGQGASATVYRAHDPRFDRGVAIKVLAEHLAGEAEAVERFSTEARALRSVDSDAIVTVYDIAQTVDGLPYMVLSLADRGTLHDRLTKGQPATDTELRELIAFLHRSLNALHTAGLVHRDVKPSNVLLTSAAPRPDKPTAVPADAMLRADDRLMLADLGLVKDTKTGRALTRGAGTHNYAAPEQRAVVSRVTTRTDIYAASTVIAEAALGRLRGSNESWSGVLAAIRHDRPLLANALATGSADQPESRPATMADWAGLLLGALGSAAAPSQAHAPPIERDLAAIPAARRRLVGVAASVALLVLAIFAVTRPADPVQSAAGGDETPTSTAIALEPAAPAARETSEPAASAPVTAAPTALTFDSVLARTQVSECPDSAEGPVPELTVLGATTTSATLGWTAREAPMSIFVNGAYHDNVRPRSDRYVVEGLAAGDHHQIGLTNHDEGPELGTWVCAATDGSMSASTANAPVMATELRAFDVTTTSATLSWTPAVSGGRYLTFQGTLATGKRFPDIVGVDAVAAGSPTMITFTNLIPGTANVVGVRTVLGDNQSNLAWIIVDTPPESDSGGADNAGASDVVDNGQPAATAASPCNGTAAGPIPELAVLGTTTSLVITEWVARETPMSVFINGRYHDNIKRNANRYAVEGLEPNSDYRVTFTDHDVAPEFGSSVCATTTGDLATGATVATAAPLMAAGLSATNVSATTAELTWTASASGGRYVMFHGTLPAGKSFPSVTASGAVAAGAPLVFLFTDLAPESKNVIGLRTVLGDNQSNLAWITIDTPAIDPNGNTASTTETGTDGTGTGQETARGAATVSLTPRPTSIEVPATNGPRDSACAPASTGTSAPAPDLRAFGLTPTSATVGWTAQAAPMSLFINGRYHDSIRPDANRYVIEGLEAGTAYRVSFAAFGDDPELGSQLCVATTSATTTATDLVDTAADLVDTGAPTMATALVVSNITPTTADLAWTAASSGGRYVMYVGVLREGKRFPDITGSGAVGADAATTFTFTNLEPGAANVIGLRTVLANNQSNLVWVSVTTPTS